MLKINVITIANTFPQWVQSAIQQYQQRIKTDWQLNIVHLPQIKTKNLDAKQRMQQEAHKLQAHFKPDQVNIALDEHGKALDTLQWQQQFEKFCLQSSTINFFIGGADGFAASFLSKFQHQWQLSKLTFAHPLAMSVLSEQVYRVWSLMHNHPYHRGDT